MSRKPVPIACTLDAGAMPDRWHEWQALLAHVTTRTETGDNSLRLAFDADTPTTELTRLVVAEQACCAFFSFAITVDDRGLALEVSAPSEATEIVTALFGSA